MLLVLWDIDGTLVSSAGHGRYAFDDAFEAVVGRPYDGEITMAGRTDPQIAMEMLEGVDGAADHAPRMLEELVAALDERRQLLRSEGHAYPGVPEALEALAARDGVAQALLTGNVRANAELKVSAFGLERWLDFELGAYGSDPHTARSDLVAIARDRAVERHAGPLDVVLVGDTPLDIEAARDGGARVVAVASGSIDLETLRAAGPDAVFPDLRQTERVLAAITQP